MAAAERKRSSRGRRSGSAWRALSGTGIALVGFAVGLVAGAVLEAPRLLIEWLRGPVQSVEVAAADPAPIETGPLREVSELHRPAARRSPARRSERVAPATPAPRPAEAVSAAPRPPALASAPRPAPPAAPSAPVPVPGGVVADLRREVEARAPAERPAVVQVASTPDSAEAQRIVARLRASGFDAFSVAVQPNGTTTHRVRVRTPRDQTPAAVAEKLRAQGFDTWITRD